MSMHLKHLTALLFLFLPALAFAQTAAELDLLMETHTVTTGVAARFALGAAGMTPPGLSGDEALNNAYQAAFSRGWVRKGPEDAITLQETAFLLMNVLNLKGGVMYSVFRSPRYAYREMVYQKLILGRKDAGMNLSGLRFLQILGRTLNYSGEREQMDAMLLNSGAIN